MHFGPGINIQHRNVAEVISAQSALPLIEIILYHLMPRSQTKPKCEKMKIVTAATRSAFHRFK